ncbi:MAG: cytochrome c [Cognatishimia sp.]|uniref:c-type cytochrome n=1 Tax=Cognatishimia sp. TaxID=2211648 RepID=UPI003B8D47E1
MTRLAIITAFTFSLVGAALAHQGVKDAKVKAWMHAMMQAGQASKTLGNMAKGTAAFDADQAADAQAILIEVSAAIPTLFEVKSDDPVSEALPAIWEDYADFTGKAEAMKAASETLDVSSAETLTAGMRSLGRSCGGCHQSYRK